MMSRPFLAAAPLVLLVVIAACNQAPTDQANAGAATRPITVRNTYQEQMLQLTDLNRDLALRRAIRDDGGSCPKINGGKYQQVYKGMAMWVAHCSSGDWAVFIAASGVVQARLCKEAEQLKLPACHP